MNEKPEIKPVFLSEDKTKLWDLYLSMGIQGADDLRKELGLDELNFRRLAPNLNGQPKQYFLYRVLDEVQKAALKIAQWKEDLRDLQLDQLQRLDFETTIDDQQFRARKLAEALVDSILFSTTDDQIHYADYFFCMSLTKSLGHKTTEMSFSASTTRTLNGVQI